MKRGFALLMAVIGGLAIAAQCPLPSDLAGTITGSPSTQTTAANSVAMPKTMCTALALAFFNANFLACQNAQTMDANLADFAKTVGTDKDDTPDAADFAPLTTYLGSPPQIHEKDGEFLVLAFVSAQAPAHIEVDNGIVKDHRGIARGRSWDCGADGAPQNGDDTDCLPGFPNANGVIAFELVPDASGHRGAGTVTVTQGTTVISIPFTVVGEASSISVTTLKPAVQNGLSGGTDNASAGTMRPPGDDPAQQCVFPSGGATGLVEANLSTERAIATASVTDSDGTAIIGAFVRWQSDNPEIGTAALPLVPTLDTGTLGYAAPNIICGTAGSGNITLTETTTRFDGASGYPVDLMAPEVSATAPMTVLGLPCLPLVCTPSPTPTPGAPTATPTNTATKTPTPSNTPTITPTPTLGAPCQPTPCTATPMPSPTPTATLPPAPDAITVSSAAANASVPSGNQFTIDFAITASSLNYNGIQWEIAYSPNISFVSATYTCTGPNPPNINFPSETDTQPFEFAPDPGNPVANYKGLGGGSSCASLSTTFPGTTQLGHFVSVTLQCDSDGPSSVVIVGADRDQFYGTTLIAPDTSMIPTGLRPHASAAFPADAGFDTFCGAAPATHTPTPAPPTSTPTPGSPTSTPTITPTGTITPVATTDTDGDGCPDQRELGSDHRTGGQRNPADPNDFFDVPVPVLRPADHSGTRNGAISIADVIATVAYIGTSAANPNGANAAGLMYGSDLNGNGKLDGQEYDRSPSTDPTQPWRPGPPSGAVSIADAIVQVNSVGDNCQ